LLSTAVVRMAELSPTYRSYSGLAHRDLEKAIRADRVELRGHAIGARAGSPVTIPRPLSPRYEVNLHHNTVLLKRPGPSGAELLFRDVEIEWTGAAEYLRGVLIGDRGSDRVATTPAPDEAIAVPKTKRSRKRRERANEAIRALWRASVPRAIENQALCTEVNEWLKNDCKKRGIKHVDISNDTILRAAGRRPD